MKVKVNEIMLNMIQWMILMIIMLVQERVKIVATYLL